MFDSKANALTLNFVRTWGAHLALAVLAVVCLYLYQRCEDLESAIDDAQMEISDANDTLADLEARAKRLERNERMRDAW